MKNLAYVLFTCLTLFISSNVYAMTLEIKKSEILNEEILKSDYSSIKYGIKSEDGKIYYMFIKANSKDIYDKNVIKDKEGNLKIMNVGTDIIIQNGNLETISTPIQKTWIRIVFGFFVILSIIVFYFNKKYLIKHSI